MAKRIISSLLVLVFTLCIMAPVFAHPFNPNNLPPPLMPNLIQIPVPQNPVVCPAVGCGIVAGFMPGTIVEIQQGDFPCFITPGCIVHEHVYHIMFTCPVHGPFMVTMEYVFSHKCPPPPAPQCPSPIGWIFVRYGP